MGRLKKKYKKIGRLTNTTGNDSLLTSAAGFPFIDANSVLCNGTEFKEEFIVVSAEDNISPVALDMGIREAMHNGFLFARFGNQLITSGYYKISNMVETSGGNMKLTIDAVFGEDVRFLSPLQTTADIQSGAFIELSTKIPENKAEFDGRFFVKILNDLALKDNILKFNSGGTDWRVIGALNSYYINYSKVIEDAVVVNGSLIEDIDGLPSTQIRFAAVPNSKDIVPVRNQILEIDLINTAVVGGVDNISVGSSSNSSYTTSSSNPNTTAF